MTYDVINTDNGTVAVLDINGEQYIDKYNEDDTIDLSECAEKEADKYSDIEIKEDSQEGYIAIPETDISIIEQILTKKNISYTLFKEGDEPDGSPCVVNITKKDGSTLSYTDWIVVIETKANKDDISRLLTEIHS